MLIDRGINTAWFHSSVQFFFKGLVTLGLKITLKHETGTYQPVLIPMSTHDKRINGFIFNPTFLLL